MRVSKLYEALRQITLSAILDFECSLVANAQGEIREPLVCCTGGVQDVIPEISYPVFFSNQNPNFTGLLALI